MSNIIEVKAQLRLLNTEEGGRITALERGVTYRPNHVFEEICKIYGSYTTWIGQIELQENKILKPEEEGIVVVKFINDTTFQNIIKVGITWNINEGRKLVGIGTILEIIGTKDTLK